MKQRRVLHVTRQLKYGSANVLDQLVRNLDRKRYEPVVAFESTEKSTIRQKLDESDIKTVDLIKAEYETVNKKQNNIKARNISQILEKRYNRKTAEAYLALKSVSRFAIDQAKRVRPFLKVIRENRIDLVHTHSHLTHAKPEILAARIAGKPCIAHVHAYMEPTYFEKVYTKLVSAFIYISHDIARHFHNRGFPESKTKIVHNGVNLKNYQEPCYSDDIRNELKIGLNEVIVGLIGRIDWWKGHDYFIEAFAEASKKTAPMRGLIVGEPSDDEMNQRFYNMLKKKVKKLNLDGKIIFTGFRKDVPKLLSAMDIVIHASSEPEPFGLVAIEGMAAGKPVIATAAGGILDIIQDGINGLLVPCKDSKALEKAIVALAVDKNKAIALGKASRRRIVDKFTIEKQAKAVETIYDSFFEGCY